ncbi:MAG: hypothetical protein QXR62_04570 [Candidatus Bathyarchaeia archaeon]
MKLRGTLHITVYNQNNEKLQELETESKSLVLNLARVLTSGLSASGGESLGVKGVQRSTTVYDYDGIERTVWTHWYASVEAGGGVMLAMKAAEGDDTFGILVGSGSTPVAYNDYKLFSKISHGSGAGQLYYQSQSTVSSFGALSSYVELARSFVNVSANPVIVREVGLAARSYWKDRYAVQQDQKFLIARDVLPNPVTVPSLATLVVRYRISLEL